MFESFAPAGRRVGSSASEFLLGNPGHLSPFGNEIELVRTGKELFDQVARVTTSCRTMLAICLT